MLLLSDNNHPKTSPNPSPYPGSLAALFPVPPPSFGASPSSSPPPPPWLRAPPGLPLPPPLPPSSPHPSRHPLRLPAHLWKRRKHVNNIVIDDTLNRSLFTCLILIRLLFQIIKKYVYRKKIKQK